MARLINSVLVVLLALSVSMGVASASPGWDEIGGAGDDTIASTRVIERNTRLVSDITCTTTTTPCIAFGASGIKLSLNGFTITGPGEPDAAPAGTTYCNATSGPPPADGVAIAGRTDAQILGPGMIQKFRRHGIFVGNSSGIRVLYVTSHHNCFSGFLAIGMTDSEVDRFVSVRNANNSTFAPCGGICIVNSSGNKIKRGHFAGNGSIESGNNDFGVGLVFASSGNEIEENHIGGNTNGILIFAEATGNVIRDNVIAGNPPGQVSRTFGASVGWDVRDLSTASGSTARNTFERNWCISYSGPGPAPCPSFPGPDSSEDTD